MKNFKELKRVMQASGGYGIPKYATAINMHKVNDNLSKASAEHCPPGQRYDPAHDRCNLPVKESRYADAMTSRLPAHLDDPRHDEKIDRERKAVSKASGSKDPFWKDLEKRKAAVKENKHPYVTKGKFDYKKFSADRKKNPAKFIAGVNESTWESYRQQALLESMPKHAPKAAVRDIEKALRKLSGHPITVSMGSGKSVPMKEELTPREQQSHAERLKPVEQPEHEADKEIKKAKPFDGSKMKTRAITSSAWIKGIDHMKEEHQTDFPNPGHVMDFHDRMEHSYHGGHEAKTARDAYAKHLKAKGHKVKKGSLPNQILHGNYGNVYTVSHKRTMEESTTHVVDTKTGLVVSSHPSRHEAEIGRTKQNLKNFISAPGYRKPKDRLSLVGISKVNNSATKLKESEIAFNESGPPKHPHAPIDIHHRGIYVATTTWSKNQKHAKAKWLSLHPDHKESDVKTSLKEATETYKVGDRVVPKIGPHKGEPHEVIHVHTTGHLNITPERRGYGRKNRYRLGAAKAHPGDVTRLEEHMTPKYHTLGPLTLEKPKKKLPVNDKHGWIRNRGNQFKSWPAGVKTTNVWNRKTVQEVFQAAKDKKKGENPFAKKDTDKDAKPQKELVDNLPTDGANEPNKDLSAQSPQFGKKEGGEEKKQSNAPKAEKKTGKIEVQGPGPDDKFQPDPTVSPLTCMPDTVSPKSGSQGVR